MRLKPGKKTTNEIKFSPRRHFCAPLVVLALISSALLAHAARATSLLDPEPEDSTTLFGRAIAVLGDVNGDGVTDLAVAAPYQDGDFPNIDQGFGPPQNVGKVWVLNGANLSVITVLNDPQFQVQQALKFGGQFGTTLAAVGDVNGDGKPDVLVGTPNHTETDTGPFNIGRAFVMDGGSDTVLFTLDDPTPQENARAGTSVASLGDVNADGKPDFLVGVPGKDVGDEFSSVGVAYIYSGANGSLIRTLNDPTAADNARFGSAVANAGDVDGDGVADALIGAPGHSEAFVFSGRTGSLIFSIPCPVAETLPSFGSAVAGGKDFNNDGKPDFVIGAPLLKNSQGAVFVFNGSDGTLQRRLKIPTSQKSARVGASVAVTSDLTGDGRPDIMVGVPDQDVGGLINAGETLIYNGANGRLFQTLTSATPQAFAGFGSALATADFDGDGTPTTIVGVPFQNADLIDPDDGDIVTHLQIGQIEIQ
jgi:FG-GAP repeat